MSVTADYFDGQSSRRRTVSVEIDADVVHIVGGDVALDVPIAAVRDRPQVGSAPRRVELPAGALLVVADPDAIDQLLPSRRAPGFAHRLESHLGFVLACLIALPILAWGAYRAAVPLLAREAARRLPPNLEHQLGEVGMQTLDQSFFSPSALDPERQERLGSVFRELRLQAALPSDVRLELRRGRRIGPNAFAVPGSIVVVTDELVNVVGDEDRIAAILAHELGHLSERHSLRALLQDSFIALASLVVFADASAATVMAASLPALLAHARYSRDFEREADVFGLALLRRSGRSPRLFAEALAALETAQRDGSHEGRSWSALAYLSTHPLTADRMGGAEDAARVP